MRHRAPFFELTHNGSVDEKWSAKSTSQFYSFLFVVISAEFRFFFFLSSPSCRRDVLTPFPLERDQVMHHPPREKIT